MSRRLVDGIVRGLTQNVAYTSPSAEDPRLRGRTYAVPFEDVWRAATGLVGGGLRHWEILEADDQEGVIRGTAHGMMERFTSGITVRITLDADAQTRVDAMSARRTGRAGLGVNGRRLHRFFTRLDRAISESRGRPIDALRLDR